MPDWAGVKFGPAWSPDGETLTFATNRDGPFQLYETPVSDLSEARPLFDDGALRQTDPIGISVPTFGMWSSTGEYFVAYRELPGGETGRDILRWNRNGNAESITATGAQEKGVRVSPDDRWVAYVSNREGEDRVYLQPFSPGGQGVEVSSGPGAEPMWSRDGMALYYRDGQRMMIVESESASEFRPGPPAVLFEGPFATDPTGVGNANYAVASDGRFLMIGESGSDQLIVVQNWTQELERLLPAQ